MKGNQLSQQLFNTKMLINTYYSGQSSGIDNIDYISIIKSHHKMKGYLRRMYKIERIREKLII